jgi:hypothetical protein
MASNGGETDGGFSNEVTSNSVLGEFHQIFATNIH